MIFIRIMILEKKERIREMNMRMEMKVNII
jgi:hypothetical protein